MIKNVLLITALFALYSVIIHFWYDCIPFIFRPLISLILANLTALLILIVKYKLQKNEKLDIE